MGIRRGSDWLFLAPCQADRGPSLFLIWPYEDSVEGAHGCHPERAVPLATSRTGEARNFATPEAGPGNTLPAGQPENKLSRGRVGRAAPVASRTSFFWMAL